MKYLVLAAVIFATVASCAQNETNSNNQRETTIQTKNTDNMEKEEKKKIEGLLSTYQTCLNTSNAKLAQSLYTKDGVFMPTEAPSGIGAEGILKSYEFVFAQIQLNIEFQIIVVRQNFDFRQ